MLEFKDIELVAGNKLLFNLAELKLDEGLYALVGRNGTGKSSFLKAILNEFKWNRGQITLDGNLLNTYSKAELAKHVAVVYSQSDIFGDHTVADVVLLGRLPYQNLFAKSTELDVALVNEVSEALMITNLLERQFNSLSDGEKQLVMIARAFVQDTGLILLDEPSAFLDLVNRNRLTKLLYDYAKIKNKLILFSTHDIDLLDTYCDGVLFINEEELKLMDSTTSYLDQIKTAFNI